MMMQPEHESRRGDSRRSCTGIKLPAPGCSHRVQIGRRQRQRWPRRRRRITALHGVALVGPRLGCWPTPCSKSWGRETHTTNLTSGGHPAGDRRWVLARPVHCNNATGTLISIEWSGGKVRSRGWSGLRAASQGWCGPTSETPTPSVEGGGGVETIRGQSLGIAGKRSGQLGSRNVT